MTKRLFVRIIEVLILIVIVGGLLTAFIDYNRMKSNKYPIFCTNTYNSKKHIQKYRGVFYQASRKINSSLSEELKDSTNIKFIFLFYDMKIPNLKSDDKYDLTINTTEISNCMEESKLYYADKNIKIYTYCLEKIEVKENNKSEELNKYIKKNNKIMDTIISNLDYAGLVDKTTSMYTNSNNFTNNGLTMYQCNKENINDIYIGPKDMSYRGDFCTYKDDDFKYIFEIEDKSPKKVDTDQVEIIYVDDNYIYQFDYPRSNYIYIVTPAIRGRASSKITLREALDSGLLTIEDLEDKGLGITKNKKQ